MLFRSPDTERRRGPRVHATPGHAVACTASQLVQALARAKVPLRLYDQFGMVSFETSAFARLLPSGTERRRILESVAMLVRQHTANAAVRTESFEVTIRGTRQRFNATQLGDGPTGVLGILLIAMPADQEPKSDGELRDLYALTQQEIRVVRLLAAGRSTAAIAAELIISVHTARRHCERVLAKMQLRSRSLVNRALADSG